MVLFGNLTTNYGLAKTQPIWYDSGANSLKELTSEGKGS